MPDSRKYYGAAEHCDQMSWDRGPILLAGPQAVRAAGPELLRHSPLLVALQQRGWAILWAITRACGQRIAGLRVGSSLGLVSVQLSPGRFGAAPAECSSGWQLGSQRFSRYSVVHKLRWGLLTLSMRCFSEYTVIFSLCVFIHMNMMVSFHYNKKLFPRFFSITFM